MGRPIEKTERMQFHTIPPVFDENSRILVLGSFPSVKSREEGFFYGNPQNRFWRVLAMVFGCEKPGTISEKRTMLLENKIALWDVIESCEIEGSDDSSIRSVVPNDLGIIMRAAGIERIFTNGGTADRLYKKYCFRQPGTEAVRLPSTSPANARYSIERLTVEWKVLRNDCYSTLR